MGSKSRHMAATRCLPTNIRPLNPFPLGSKPFSKPYKRFTHPRGYHKAIAAGQFDDGAMKLRDDELMDRTLIAEASHPVVRTHPETGRKALYVNKSYTVGFQGWTEAESRPLLDFLIDHAVKPEFSCRFRWQPKSMALWDNRCAMHLAINDVHGYRRVMHRVVAEGDRPY